MATWPPRGNGASAGARGGSERRGVSYLLGGEAREGIQKPRSALKYDGERDEKGSGRNFTVILTKILLTKPVLSRFRLAAVKGQLSGEGRGDEIDFWVFFC